MWFNIFNVSKNKKRCITGENYYVMFLLVCNNGNVAQRNFSQCGGKRRCDVEIAVQQEAPQRRSR